jgi:hypothetical protein
MGSLPIVCCFGYLAKTRKRPGFLLPNNHMLKNFFSKMFVETKNACIFANTKQQQFFFPMEMNTTQLIEKAAELANNPSSIFCANQAKQISSIERSAKMWALKSIAHSVGIFHPIYVSNDWK